MTLAEWLAAGLEAGWCGPGVCAIHDGVPMTAGEEDEDEPCVFIVRLYEDADIKQEVEANHSPSRWRAL